VFASSSKVEDYFFIRFVAQMDDVEKYKHSIGGPHGLVLWHSRVQDLSMIREKCTHLEELLDKEDNPIIIEFRPVFECSTEDGWWGRRPPAPEHDREATVDHILTRWVKQTAFFGTFYKPVSELPPEFVSKFCNRFHNGGPLPPEGKINMPPKRVDLTVALRHTDDWEVDWDKHLNADQVQFVKRHTKYFRTLARALFRPNPVCEYCGKLEGLSLCSQCKRTNYCNRQCQLADWDSHMMDCKKYKAMRGNEEMGNISWGMNQGRACLRSHQG
jgi:hypothetical protein